MPERKPIFYDEQRRRWRRTRRVLEIAGGFFTIVLVIFVVNLIRNPDLPDILRADTHGTLHAIRGRLKPKSVRPGRKHKVSQLGKIPQNYDPLRAAFYVSWDSNSLASLQSALSRYRPACSRKLSTQCRRMATSTLTRIPSS